METTFDTFTHTVTIPAGQSTHSSAAGLVSVPDGTIVHVGIVTDNSTNEILNFSLLQDGNEVIRKADVRFSTRSAGGNFRESLRPTNIIGGRNFEIKLEYLPSVIKTVAVTAQIMFVVEKKSIN